MQRAFTSVFFIAILAGPTVAEEELSREQLDFFESKIRPVLIRECYGCHSNQSGNVRGGLRLDTKELMQIGGATGPAIVPGNPEESWLYNAITHQDYVMPPKRKLPQSVIDDFRKWIEMGAPDPRVSNIGEIRSSISEKDVAEARDNFWAYRHPQPQAPPAVRNVDWCDSEIDSFVMSKLEQNEMAPAADAEPRNVLRRLYFDIIGLPPTPEQIDSFQQAWKTNQQDAVAKVVDELLGRDQYGERWGRHWLDVVRYAESTGREVNMTYPHAWRYRDYVIDSFNDDKPFDRFVQEQLAGDLLPVRTDEQWANNLIATTFLAVGAKNVNEQNRVQFRADVIDEQIDATTRVFLGTSVACARCHDHKFDAIPQTDYYALAGIFGNMTTYFGNAQSELGRFSGAQTRQESNLIRLPIEDPNPYDASYTKEEIAELKDDIREKIQSLSSFRRNRNSDGNQGSALRDRLRTLNELQQLSGKLGNVDDDGNPRSFTMGVQEKYEPRDARLLVRGEIDQAAQPVERGFPAVLCSAPADIDDDESGRLQLARWIGSDENPLTARVMVNRIWKYMLGRGIVTSTENFGVTGQPPSHPELLDHLAVLFVESGWSVKAVVREIATSHTYRIGTAFNESYHQQDPDNALLWRANPRRLDAEVLRDSMLAISGEIDLQRPRGSEVAKAGYRRVQGGVIGDPRELARKAAADAMKGRQQSSSVGRFGNRGRRPQFGGRSQSSNRMRNMGADMMSEIFRRVSNQLDMEDAKYRSVYLPIVRDEEPRSLAVFDFADSSSIIGQREVSNTADQALYMMNNPFVIQQSQTLADRIAASESLPGKQVAAAFRLTFGREPTGGELSATKTFLRSWSTTNESQRNSNGRNGALAAICQSLFASAEFRYVD